MSENTETISTQRALLYLLGCAVNDLAPQRAVLCAMDWKAVCQLSQQHTVAAAACMAVEHGLCAAAEPFVLDEAQQAALAYWKDAKNKAIRKNMLLDTEREALGEFCERIGCWYVPLKGVVLKELYPHIGMRQMSDNDIWYDPAFEQQICDWFFARGYTAESVGQGNVDAYYKEPIYNFELHRALFNDAFYPAWVAYYEALATHLLPDGTGRFKRRFREEDCYVYITLHEYKHFTRSGIGVRGLLDRYVFCTRKADVLDWTYTQAELQTLAVAEFEEQTRALSKAVFADPEALLQAEFSAQEKELLAYYFGSGTYGNMENRVNNQMHAMVAHQKKISRMEKLQYLLRRAFPTQSQLRINYPRLASRKVLLPLCYAHRLFIKAGRRRKKIWDEIKIVAKT